MSKETLFIIALVMQAPWLVKDVTFSIGEFARSDLHLHADDVPGSGFLGNQAVEFYFYYHDSDLLRI